ncbi:HAD family hydrolase [Caproiciproducens faecalis]|uniref:Uncharacterized protein n=1 Tax=Caproiciproducens faecalis TaxID=2820301 RepID=A0ABS7DN99_9FIRM|nr:hypothetical protein [Caproiciproducens faecalis]MBW7572757.1 hypothetical protein [Caproiciproducens faecalis]
MGDNQKAPRDKFSLDEILAEARTLETGKQEPAPTENKAKADPGRKKTAATPEEIAKQAKIALDAKVSSMPTPPVIPEPEKKQKRGKGLFRRRKRDFSEPDEEQDIYYGLQLRSLEDYREEYGKIETPLAHPEKRDGDPIFSYLFSETADGTVDDEVAERFERLHNERKKRVEKIMSQAGLDEDDIFSLCEDQPACEKPEAKEPPPEPEEPAEPQAPTVIPPPAHPAPGPVPQPKPEIEPGPVPQPEIREPLTEPVFQPSSPPMTPPTPLQPDSAPLIRCRMSEEPVKEPVAAPRVKEEVPPPPAVREPGKPVPQSAEHVHSYRTNFKQPVHFIQLNNYEEVLTDAAAGYPPAKPKQPPPPIPISVIPAGGEDLPVRETEQTAQAAQPIPFPEPAFSGELSPEEADDLENSFETEPPSEEKAERKKSFSVFGNEEEDNDSTDNLPGEQEELDDYQSPGDAPSIFHDLHSNIRTLYLRLAVTGISFVILLAFGILRDYASLLPAGILNLIGAQPYIILNLVFLLVAAAFSITPILNGLKGLAVFQANADSGVAVAVVAALIQNAALLFSVQSLQTGGLHLYSVLVVMALFLNTVGKFSFARRIDRNFHFIAAPDQKQAVQIFDDHNTALQMASGCVVDAPVIAYQTKANFLKHFLSLSYEPDPSEQSSQLVAPIGFVSSLILCIVTLILTKDVYGALTAFAAAACICVPFVNMLSVNLPVNRVCRIAARCGAMIIGYPAIDRFSSTNAVLVDAKELFPKGTVVLNAIKTFGGQRIDDAIVDATALMCAVGGPLSDLFDQIIKSRREMLPKIDNTVYEDDKGVTGWVSGRRILVGSRKLMEAHHIEPPSRDYEEKYTRTGKRLVYLASGGELVAMFVLSYNSDRRRAMELRRMENNGISLIVRTCDPNITPALLTECFGLDEHSVRVLPERLGSIYAEMTAAPQERSDAVMVTKGRPTAMMRLLAACVRQRSNISIAVALQNVAVILGFLLVAFLACYSGLGQMTVTALMIYELFWAAAILIVPRIRKP